MFIQMKHNKDYQLIHSWDLNYAIINLDEKIILDSETKAN